MLQSRTTYYFDVLEQLVGQLPDEYIESTVLAYLKPYLEVATQKAPFESAHSVVLAIFSQDKAVAHQLAPYYTHLLLRVGASHLPEERRADDEGRASRT